MGGRLELRNVYKDFGGFKLDNVNLTLEAGAYFVLVGPTGSGKTLLLETINGFHRVDYAVVREMSSARFSGICGAFGSVLYGLNAFASSCSPTSRLRRFVR